MDDHRIFDRELLAMRRARAAARLGTGRNVDFLLREAARDIADRVSFIKRDFPLALDLGGHTGALADALAGLPNVGTVLRAERVAALLKDRPAPRLVCDEEFLPFAHGTLDLVVSGLSLHWVNDLPGALAQITRALKPDGLFLAALLGGETLWELRAALTEAESDITGGAAPRVAPFVEVREMGGLLQRAGLALPVADSDRLTIAYDDMIALMRDLRAMGATNVLLERARKPLRRDVLARAGALYTKRHARADGRITATFEIVTATGWRPHESQQKPLRPGAARTRLADALGTREVSAGDKARPGRPRRN